MDEHDFSEDAILSEDESIYNESVRDQMLEDDELSSMEAGFMQGYGEAYSA